MFDGVHVGHRHILSLLGRVAEEKGLRPVVVTFDRHPRQVLTEGVATHFRITTNEERGRLLSQCGVDTVVELPFTPQLAGMSACEFFEQVLVGSEVSSTRIRKALEQGQTDRAASMLGRGYVMWGTVEKGRQLGRLLGFPTANVSLADPTKVWPADGVYAVWVTLSDGTAGLKGMANFGAQPTFGLDKPVFEVNIFDFEGDLYDSTLTVEFGPRLRDICRFDNVPTLVEQLRADREAARRLLQRGQAGNTKK